MDPYNYHPEFLLICVSRMNVYVYYVYTASAMRAKLWCNGRYQDTILPLQYICTIYKMKETSHKRIFSLQKTTVYLEFGSSLGRQFAARNFTCKVAK